MDLQFDKKPSLPWFRILFGRKRGFKELSDFPQVESRWDDVCVETVEDYQRICGFPVSNTLPVTFPQVLATPLHMQMLASSLFPLPVMGLVHVGQSIKQFRPIAIGENLSIRSWVDGLTRVKSGGEFSLHTEIFSGEEKVWTGTARTFTRGIKGNKNNEKRKDPPELGDDPSAEVWEIPENLGRRYMRISGDFNFIHVHALLAKPFGFKRAIIHGMWSLARCVASLPEPTQELEAKFIRPVFLPSKVRRLQGYDGGDMTVHLCQPDTGKLHLSLRARRIED